MHCIKAAFSANYKSIELLLDAGADVNSKTTNGYFPLEAAVMVDHGDCESEADVYVTEHHNHVKSVDLLIKAGADVNLIDEHDQTPLTFAVQKEHVQCVNKFIKAGADVNNQNQN